MNALTPKWDATYHLCTAGKGFVSWRPKSSRRISKAQNWGVWQKFLWRNSFSGSFPPNPLGEVWGCCSPPGELDLCNLEQGWGWGTWWTAVWGMPEISTSQLVVLKVERWEVRLLGTTYTPRVCQDRRCMSVPCGLEVSHKKGKWGSLEQSMNRFFLEGMGWPH